jgi:ubiquinone/menaquinone biosynthesis C-methylase UbiE
MPESRFSPPAAGHGKHGPLRNLAERTPRLPRAATYRYRTPSGNGASSRLDTIDLDLLGLRDGDRLLDVGCGTGRHVIHACRRRCSVIGIDRDLGELQALKFLGFCLATEGKLRARAGIAVGDALRLPFADASFDHVICTEVFEHVPDDNLLLAELARVLRPGGTIAVSVPDMLSEWLVWRAASVQKVSPGEHVRLYRRGRMPRVLRSHGFDVYARRFRHSLETPYWLLWLGAKDGGVRRRLAAAWKDFLGERAADGSHVLARVESFGDTVLPKSAVFYARKSIREPARCG